MKIYTILLASLLTIPGLAKEPIHYADLIAQSKQSAITGTEYARAVGKSADAHLIQACDTQRTKRRAHLFTSITDQKRLDNAWKMHRLDASLETISEIMAYDAQGRPLTRTTSKPTMATTTLLEREEDKWDNTASHLQNALSLPLLWYGISSLR